MTMLEVLPIIFGDKIAHRALRNNTTPHDTRVWIPCAGWRIPHGYQRLAAGTPVTCVLCLAADERGALRREGP